MAQYKVWGDYSHMLTNKCFAYIGTYTHGKSKGIYIFRFDGVTGRLEPVGSSPELENPSYVCISNNGSFLYAVMETEMYNGEPGGAVGAYSIDRNTGLLRFLNSKPTKGTYPCHLSTDSSNRFLFTANYGNGILTVFPLEKDGHIGSPASIIRHEGSGPDKIRQEGPHVHYTVLTPDEKYLCAVDLGLDKINAYGFSAGNGLKSPLERLSVDIKPGSGPRHLEFSPNGNFAYLLTELSSEVVVFKYDPAGGGFTHIQTLPTLAPDTKVSNFCAAIHISPGGEHLYASNRGHDSISHFKIHQESGMLELVSHISTQGKMPRDFAIDPSGRFLLAANQDSDTLVVYEINPQSGEPEPTGNIIEIPSPTCIKFACFPFLMRSQP